MKVSFAIQNGEISRDQISPAGQLGRLSKPALYRNRSGPVELITNNEDCTLVTVGLLAAGLTSLSYIPQVKKALPVRPTDDLSLRTLLALATGLALG